MKNDFLISVVVPAYNEEETIDNCLAALLHQTVSREDYEIIVVDNNSTDRTCEIAKGFDAQVVSEPRQGYVYALRKGFSESRGRIVALTDADTVVPQDWLEKIGEIYLRDPDVVAVGGRGLLRPKTPLSMVVQPLIDLFGGRLFKIFSGFNYSVRRDIYEEMGGFRQDLNFNTDSDLCLRLRKSGKLVFLWDNRVVTSSRHYEGWQGLFYALKSPINLITLFLFNRTVFFEFGDVR